MSDNSILKAALATGVALAALSCAAAAKSQPPKKVSPEQILYYFQGGTDGGQANSNLVADQSGNLYGTTKYGGDVNCSFAPRTPRKPPPVGCGTLFKVASDGTETVLHAFGSYNGDGVWPIGYLSADSAGNLYGMANEFGTIFKVTPDGTESVLYSSNGSLVPSSSLLPDSQGNLYGASQGGAKDGDCGADGCGYIFRLAPNGTLTTVYTFTGPDGALPSGALAMDSSGNVYGTTMDGGAHGWGTVFELTPSGTESVLYSFDVGSQPQSGVTIDAQGNLYGVTASGGTNNDGSVFKVTPGGTGTILYSFLGRPDGNEPLGTPVVDASGNVYGTTYFGGAYNFGTAFKVAPNGTETVLFNFKKRYGDDLTSGVVLDQSGNVYGTTMFGGNQSGKGNGVVFKLTE
ncbi:MAG TPA: choice-of-anchor tandem repeat GloVer-containing protein [Rhizomicrobium sp.]|jgi:uncharacterized repeat protein (TIGR03803 family)